MWRLGETSSFESLLKEGPRQLFAGSPGRGLDAVDEPAVFTRAAMPVPSKVLPRRCCMWARKPPGERGERGVGARLLAAEGGGSSGRNHSTGSDIDAEPPLLLLTGRESFLVSSM